MKRTQLIEWGMLSIGLIFAYKAIESLFAVIVRILFLLDADRYVKFSIVTPLISSILYAILFILIIRNSNKLAVYVNGAHTDDTLPITINKKSLTQVILISICIVTLLTTIPSILSYLYDFFVDGVRTPVESAYRIGSTSNMEFRMGIIQSIIAFVVIYFSKDITQWFIRKNELDELTFDSTPEK